MVVIGDEGEGSLLSLLKKEGLVQWLSVSPSDFGEKNHVLELRVGLTKAGLAQRDLVVQRIFEALATFTSKPLPHHIVEELNTVSLHRYQYQARRNPFKITVSVSTASWLKLFLTSSVFLFVLLFLLFLLFFLFFLPDGSRCCTERTTFQNLSKVVCLPRAL